MDVLTLTRVASFKDLKPVRDYILQKGLTFRVILGDDAFARDYKLNRVPTIWVIDKKRVLKKIYQGQALTEGDVEQLVKSIIKL